MCTSFLLVSPAVRSLAPQNFPNLPKLLPDFISNSPPWSHSALWCDSNSTVQTGSPGDRGGREILNPPPGQLYSCGAGSLSLAARMCVCVCECQTGGQWGGDLRIGQKLLAKAVLEVPLVWFSIFFSRRAEPQRRWRGGGGPDRMQID